MCGIVGYVGEKQAAPIVLEALKKLEYRGYDSAGLAVINDGKISINKARGRLSELCRLTEDGAAVPGTTGMGHTRWATHGEPNYTNAHPHVSGNGRVAVIHNGIVENFAQIKSHLIKKGYTFYSETDTEVVAQLLDDLYDGDPLSTLMRTLEHIEGAYALAVMFTDHPGTIIATRKDSPLIVGLGENENFIASDIPALIAHTRSVIRLGEREIVRLTKSSVEIFDHLGRPVEKPVQHVDWDVTSAERGGYPHFMIKEIMEQSGVINSTVSPRIHNDELRLELKSLTPEFIKTIDKIQFIACGSAFHVCEIARLQMQQMLRIPVVSELASEFRYSYPMVNERTLCIVVSQSGETIDTLLALREARSRGARVLSIVNVVGSTIATESDDVLYTWAGPEIAVATTKAYSTQLALLYLVALHLGSVRGCITQAQVVRKLSSIRALPEQIDKLLEQHEQLQYLASLYFSQRDIFFIGRNLDYALALEGSLKLKEISYIHSEAYAAGELKHGTISLIEDGTLVIALCTCKRLLDKMVSNIKEVKARGAKVIAIAPEGYPKVEATADHVVWLPGDDEMTIPSLSVIPLQLFAYYVASLKGCDIDKPRNLAKSVTVE